MGTLPREALTQPMGLKEDSFQVETFFFLIQPVHTQPEVTEKLQGETGDKY